MLKTWQWGAALAVATLLAGCAGTPEPEMTADTMNMIKRHQDLSLSGKTGWVVGSAEDKKPAAAIREDDEYPKTSLRYYFIEELEDELDPETLDALRGPDDVTFSGLNGRLVTKQATHEKTIKVETLSRETGYPIDSPRDWMIRKLYLKED